MPPAYWGEGPIDLVRAGRRAGNGGDDLPGGGRHRQGVCATARLSWRFWDQLSDTEKQIMRTCCQEALDYERAISRELSLKSLTELKEKGMVFSDIPPDEMTKMRDKVKPVVEKYVKDLGEDPISQAHAEIEKVK
jgi:TRAP-type C4-dicarboxylate transport system substrate-binding protein